MDTILEEVERLQDALDGLTMKAEERAILENRYERGVMQQLIEDILDGKVMQHDAAVEAIEYLQGEVERLKHDVTRLVETNTELVNDNERLQKCERHEYERANKAEARVAELTRDRDAARAAFDESDIACAELEARVDELERQLEVKDEQFTTMQETYQARVEGFEEALTDISHISGDEYAKNAAREALAVFRKRYREALQETDDER